jgi:hypothetical protein
MLEAGYDSTPYGSARVGGSIVLLDSCEKHGVHKTLFVTATVTHPRIWTHFGGARLFSNQAADESCRLSFSGYTSGNTGHPSLVVEDRRWTTTVLKVTVRGCWLRSCTRLPIGTLNKQQGLPIRHSSSWMYGIADNRQLHMQNTKPACGVVVVPSFDGVCHNF